MLLHTEVKMPVTSSIRPSIAMVTPLREMPPGYNFRKVKVSIQDGSLRSVNLVTPQKIPPTSCCERISAAVTRRKVFIHNLKQGIYNSIEHKKPLLREKLNRITMDSMDSRFASLFAPLAETVADGFDDVGSYIMRNQQLVQLEGSPAEQFDSDVRRRKSSANIDGKVPSTRREAVKNSSRCMCPLAHETDEDWQKRLWKKHQGPQICWEHKGIDEEEFEKYWLENKQALLNATSWNPHVLSLKERSDWVACMTNEKFTVWRKPVQGSSAFMYRVQASFKDVVPKDMFQVQTDLQLRKEWDEYISELRVLASDRRSNQELVHWITSCPKPMLPREYIYKRRTMMDDEKKLMMVFNEATKDGANVPESNGIFRVNTYTSKLLLRSQHTDFDKEGVDFILTYHDDPESNAPVFVVNKLANYGISIMMDRLHQLSKKLQKSRDEQN